MTTQDSQPLPMADSVVTGTPILPVQRLQLLSPDEWEEVVNEWLDSLRTRYAQVERHGGAGDMGRDVIAYVGAEADPWDNYQCKHYAAKLTPTDVWPELGKMVYYTFRGDYSLPREYYFVAPRGVGNALSNLLRSPEKLKAQFLLKWDKHCRREITSRHEVPLDDDLLSHFDAIDFRMFRHVTPLRLIEGHSQTRFHATRFGGGLPPRPQVPEPPPVPLPKETPYVRAILDAYAEHLGALISQPSDLVSQVDLLDHFNECRKSFYSAESLRAFSRDTLPAETFEDLQDEVHAGVVDVSRMTYADGFARALATLQAARGLPLTSHALASRLRVRDRAGICHQLVNDARLRWCKVTP